MPSQSLVQELRAQLERVVRDPTEIWCGGNLLDEAYIFASDVIKGKVCYDSLPTQDERIAILTAAIRAAVVTREAP